MGLSAEHEKVLILAKEFYENDDLYIGVDAEIYDAEDKSGYWVEAEVWISREDLEDMEE